MLRILGHRVTVTRVRRALLSDPMGEADHQRGEIRIVRGLEPSVERATLLHEIVHIVNDHLDLGLSEEQVTGVAQGVFQVLEDNQLGRNRR